MAEATSTKSTATKTDTGTAPGPDKAAGAEAVKVDAERQGTPPTEAVTAVETAGVGGDAIVVGASDRIENVFKDADTVSLVELSHDVVEEFYFPGTMRKAYRILYRKGQIVPKAEIEALNAKVDAQQGEYDGEQIVDATTLASGTNAHLQGSDK